jgi:hypothetical protein
VRHLPSGSLQVKEVHTSLKVLRKWLGVKGKCRAATMLLLFFDLDQIDEKK